LNDRYLRKNAEGYSDPTVYEAIKNIEKEDERFHKLVHTLFDMCELSGFELEWYPYTTAYKVIKNTYKEVERFHKLLHTIFYICEVSGFEIEGRIVLVDKKTGRIWR
jgi:predicted transcriptional regulator